jgi:hypothetical protein
MSGKFSTGDWISLHGQRVEVLFWPETDDGFARYAQHRTDGASSLFTEHTSILINHATLIEHGDHELLPNVDPAISNAVSTESAPVKKASAKSDE